MFAIYLSLVQSSASWKKNFILFLPYVDSLTSYFVLKYIHAAATVLSAIILSFLQIRHHVSLSLNNLFIYISCFTLAAG